MDLCNVYLIMYSFSLRLQVLSNFYFSLLALLTFVTTQQYERSEALSPTGESGERGLTFPLPSSHTACILSS